MKAFWFTYIIGVLSLIFNVSCSTHSLANNSTLNPHILQLAQYAYNKTDHNKHILTIIDFTLPSNQKRLWVIDINTNQVLINTYVAHGKNSGGLYATSFSNQAGSLKSSIGVFKTLSTYQGQHGIALRITGLDQGINDNVLNRAIVIHGAAYIGNGNTGHSWGCFAVPFDVLNQIVNYTKDGSIVFAYYPDHYWLTHSRYLN